MTYEISSQSGRPARRRRPHPARRARRVTGAVGVAAATILTGMMAANAGSSSAGGVQLASTLTANTTATTQASTAASTANSAASTTASTSATTQASTASAQAATPSASANTTTKGS